MNSLLYIVVLSMMLYMVYIFIASIWEAGGRTIIRSIMFVAIMWVFCALLSTTFVQALISCCIIAVIAMWVLEVIANVLSSIANYIDKLFNHERKNQ